MMALATQRCGSDAALDSLCSDVTASTERELSRGKCCEGDKPNNRDLSVSAVGAEGAASSRVRRGEAKMGSAS